MPQLFQVLRCYKCLVFQVHQSKKCNKWECKLCGEKQSIKRHYGLGTAKECRIHVQKLNCLRGEIDELKNNEDQDSDYDISGNKHTVTHNREFNYQPIKDSKWSNYVEETETNIEDNTKGNMTLGDAEVVLDIPKKRRKTFCTSVKRNYNVKIEAVDHSNFKNEIENEVLPVAGDGDTIRLQNSCQEKLQYEALAVENSLSKNVIKKFTPPALKPNSKWSQFTEDLEECEPDITPSPSTQTSQNDLLFSLCDVNDLDRVLHF